MRITAISTTNPDQALSNQDGELVQRTMLARESSNPVGSILDLFIKSIYSGRENVLRYCVGLKYAFPPNSANPLAVKPLDTSSSTERRMEIYSSEALALTLRSISCLTPDGVSHLEFTHIVYVSCTGQSSPGVSVGIAESLNQDITPQLLELNFFGGCAGLLNGLNLVRSIVDSQPSSRVLLCATELCSLHYHPATSKENVVVNSIFADGSIAMVCEGDALNRESAMIERNSWMHIKSTSYLFAATKDMLSWHVGGKGFLMTLSSSLPTYIQNNSLPVIQSVLADIGLELTDIEHWAIHPGGPRILDACQSALSISDEQMVFSRSVYRSYGNMSSTTVGFILERMQIADVRGYCVAIAFAPGLRMELAILHR